MVMPIRVDRANAIDLCLEALPVVVWSGHRPRVHAHLELVNGRHVNRFKQTLLDVVQNL
jgi:hypothetical protein